MYHKVEWIEMIHSKLLSCMNKRIFIDIITRWIILARDEHASTVVLAMLQGTSNMRRIPPHNLRKMLTHLWWRLTLKGFETIPSLLLVPIINRIRRCPMQLLSPKHVLTIISIRMNQFTIVITFHKIFSRETREIFVPLQCR